MNDFFFQLFGIQSDRAVDPQGVSMRFDALRFWWIAALIAAVLCLLAWWSYRSSAVSRTLKPGRRWLLTALRCAFYVLLLLMILRPVISLTVSEELRRQWLLLVDTSASQGIKDVEGGSRLDLVKKADPGAVLSEEGGTVVYEFDRRLQPVDGGIQDLAADGQASAIGDVLTDVLKRHQRESVAGVFLTSDGIYNNGTDPVQAAEQFREAGIPLFIYGTGSTSPSDIAIEALEVPEVALAGDPALVRVRVRANGMEGKTARLVLTTGGTVAMEKELTFDRDGVVVVNLSYLPSELGDLDIEAKIQSLDSEVVAENNSLFRRVKVVDSQIKVLQIEQSPRWDFKYIQAMLLREKRVDLDCLLFEADVDLTRGEETPYIEAFPSRRSDLFAYDLVLLGDVDPALFTSAQLQLLADYVAEGGGALVFACGKRFLPQAYVNSPLEPLMPVEIESGSGSGPFTRPVRLALTEAGAANPVLLLVDSIEENLALWNSLPPVYSVAQVKRAKPAAEVLVVDPDRETTDGKMPVVALQRYGSGEVLFIGTDNTWRWRKNAGDIHHTTFWGQIVQRMAGQRLVAGSRRSRLSAEAREYRIGDRVTVYGRLRTDDWQDRTEETVRAILEPLGGEGSSREVTLRVDPDMPGQYQTEFLAAETGAYRLSLADDPGASMDLEFREASNELQETAMNEALLREMAEITGGKYYSTEDLVDLKEDVKMQKAMAPGVVEGEFWTSPLYFLLLLLVLAMEWILRKRSELK